MPKRRRHKHSKKEDDLEKLSSKLKKLQQELKRVRRGTNGDSDDSEDRLLQIDSTGDESENSLDVEFFGDPVHQEENISGEIEEKDKNNTAGAEATAEADAQNEISKEPDSGIMEILGADPADIVEFSAEIHKELANRLEHIATTGLSKEARKELAEKYLVPSNCKKIGAPSMNAEIKAAVTETVVKRDKGIEMRQKQLGGAIAGLAGIINKELQSKDRDSDRSQQLMDVCRILCDIQHAESIIRRNFAIFSIKKDLKDHMVTTKIDKYLFGEDLAEALKTAKAVTKSGTDLKVKSQVKQVKPATANNLNYKAPAPARRQQGPQRSREPAHQLAAGPLQRYNRAPMHAPKPLQHPSKQTRRR